MTRPRHVLPTIGAAWLAALPLIACQELDGTGCALFVDGATVEEVQATPADEGAGAGTGAAGRQDAGATPSR